MKKEYLIIVLLVILKTINIYSQDIKASRVELQEGLLKETISEFVAFQKKWASENSVDNFAICLEPGNFKDYKIIKLTIVGRRDRIHDEEFESYIVIDGVPIFIKNNFSLFYKNKTQFIDDILLFYKIELFDYNKYLDEKRKNYKLSEEDKNAILGKDKNGNPIKVKDVQPVFLQPTNLSNGKTPQYDWEISFFKDKLIKIERVLVNGL